MCKYEDACNELQEWAMSAIEATGDMRYAMEGITEILERHDAESSVVTDRVVRKVVSTKPAGGEDEKE